MLKARNGARNGTRRSRAGLRRIDDESLVPLMNLGVTATGGEQAGGRPVVRR